jgi:hypothetical protein
MDEPRCDAHARVRLPDVRLFEASSIALAADIVQLHYLSLSGQFVTTMVEWACPVYVFAEPGGQPGRAVGVASRSAAGEASGLSEILDSMLTEFSASV